jgi:hypothetical protein
MLNLTTDADPNDDEEEKEKQKQKAPKKALNSSAFHIAYYAIAVRCY